MNIFKQLFGGQDTADLQNLVNDEAFLVDVRTPLEFEQGSVKGAVNIPLDALPSELSKFKNKHNTIVFCRSGSRSGQAKIFLENNGIPNVTNGGSLDNVKQFVK